MQKIVAFVLALGLGTIAANAQRVTPAPQQEQDTIAPVREMTIMVHTKVPKIKIGIFEMPDSVKVFSGTYLIHYYPEGITVKNKPDGVYWIVVWDQTDASRSVQALIYYKERGAIELIL